MHRKKHHAKWTRWMTAIALSFVMCHLPVGEAHAQSIRFGLRGGIDIIDMDYSGDVFHTSNRSGFFAGPTLKIKTPVVGLGVDVGVLYNQHDIKVSDRTLTQEKLIVPGNLRMGVDLGGMLGIFLSLGPQFSFNLGKSTYFWEDLEGYRKYFTLQQTTLSMNLGGGVSIGHHLEASLFYNLPLGKTADFTWDTLLDHLQDQTMHRAQATVNAWHLSVAYYF